MNKSEYEELTCPVSFLPPSLLPSSGTPLLETSCSHYACQKCLEHILLSTKSQDENYVNLIYDQNGEPTAASLEEEIVAQNKNMLQSYMDLEPATGLGIRSKLRFGMSYSVWECYPETNENCTLARHSGEEARCYGAVGNNVFA